MTNPDCTTFSLEGFRDIIEAFLEKGYSIASFADADSKKAHLILRHDVDVSLADAERFAEFENMCGYQAHYFVQVTAEQYNPATAVGRAHVRRIVDLGHQVGLHFNAVIESPDDIENRARSEAAFLSDITGAPVDMISFHRPDRSWIDNPTPIAGLPHSYQPRFYSEIGYCSDSRGGWFHGHPLRHRATEARTALQLLTHPVWWTGTQRPAPERLEAHLASRRAFLKDDLKANVTPTPRGPAGEP